MHSVFFKTFSTQLFLKSKTKTTILNQPFIDEKGVFSDPPVSSLISREKNSMHITKEVKLSYSLQLHTFLGKKATKCLAQRMLKFSRTKYKISFSANRLIFDRLSKLKKQTFYCVILCFACLTKEKKQKIRCEKAWMSQINRQKLSFLLLEKKKHLHEEYRYSNKFIMNRKVCSQLLLQTRLSSFNSCAREKRYKKLIFTNQPFWKSVIQSKYIISRPILYCSRNLTTQAGIFCNLPVYPDLSNSQIRYSRNRIRKQIIPTFKFFVNPQVERSIFKFTELENKN